MREIARQTQRLRECRERVLVGKMSGAVGTQAGLGPNGMKIQQLVMKRLCVEPATISTQILQRDRHAELACILAILASTLDKIATEIRELQRPEIGELFEPFAREKHVGSSTMPHKRDPETCEKVCGLAKIMRSLVVPALENVPTWHERDMTQSSAERFIIPEVCILIDYMLALMNDVLINLRVDSQRMKKNMQMTQGRNMAEAVMIALTRKGMSRQDAHELLRRASLKSATEKQSFREVLLKNSVVREKLSEKEVDDALNPGNYLGSAIRQIELAIEKTNRERQSMSLSS
jgi:adenylosuccinate lyase